MQEVRWGIIGAGRIGDAFAAALQQASDNRLIAVASRRLDSAEALAARYPGTRVWPDGQALLDDVDVDAIYVATPHPLHAQWAVRALQAGKHVLCEKPMGINHAEVMAMVDAAEQSQRFLMEAFMYRCHPQTLKLVELVRDGAIGELRHLQASFGFHAPLDPDGRLFASALGGGGILDVGCYPVSAARLLTGAEPTQVHAHGHLATTGVDAWSAALLAFDNGVCAQVASGISLALDNSLNLYGSQGQIRVRNPWHCADADGNWAFELRRNGRDPERIAGSASPLYVLEAEHAAAQIRAGALQSPHMTWQDSLGNAVVLDAWRRSMDLEYPQERAAHHPGPLLGTLPRPGKSAPIGRDRIRGLAKPVSRLVMGCDNQPSMSHAAVMWDQFFALGGNAFDTAFIYGQGRMETLLGHWHRKRGVREEMVIIGKGAHTPDNFPDRIAPQLTQSLERLQTDRVDVYLLHRDNPDVPVDEFLDALNDELARGRIGALGASNWTLDRVRAANDHAQRRGLAGFSVVSNQFSLARMESPIWPGVEAASDAEFRDYLEANGIALLPWSSQARGFFTPWADTAIAEHAGAAAGRNPPQITAMQPTAAELARTWLSSDNVERRNRAGRLAEQYGVEMINIALAYVLQQPFPCFPLIGPRTLAELRSCVAALDLPLSSAELRWLDLQDRSA